MEFLSIIGAVALLAFFTLLALMVILALSDADLVLMVMAKFGKGIDSLSGKVIWITGASSGIGESMAYHLAQNGCRLVLSARREEELNKVKKSCLEKFACGKLSENDILVLPIDVLKYATHEAAVTKVINHFGQIDILLNNAGRSQMASWMDIELEVDIDLFETNVLGPISLTRHVLPHMIQRKQGLVAVMSSLAGKIGLPGARSYTGAKHAVQGVFESLRVELAHENIDITLICPGPVFSQLYRLAATGKAGECLDREMSSSEKRMSTERCAYLSCIALANKVSEAWISEQPILFSAYLNQYIPNLGRYVMKTIGAKQVMKFRKGR